MDLSLIDKINAIKSCSAGKKLLPEHIYAGSMEANTQPAPRLAPRTGMKSIEKYMNLGAVILPFAATIAAIVLFWNQIVTAGDLVIFAVMYLLTAAGITVGYHRMLTHRAFQTYPAVRYILAGLGQMAVQGSVIAWVADHRKHHAHTDTDGDPHSPHVGHGRGIGAVARGLWHAHTGGCSSTTVAPTGAASPPTSTRTRG